MATAVMMRNPQTGIMKKGFYGFSWTTLFFGGIPALCRGDLKTGVLLIIACLLTGGLAGLVWAFVYNKNYTLGLIHQGYQFAGDASQVALAKQRLGISD